VKALFWDGESLALVERDVPRIGDDFALIRVHVAGICNTDLEIARGYMGFRGVLGHEIVGTVTDGPPPWRGARVTAEINFACGECESCQAGLARHCPTRTVMGILAADGGFAEHVAVPVANLHRVPDDVPDRRAVFAEPLAAAYEILEQVPVDSTTRCTVLGDGKLGLLAAQVLAGAGAAVTAVGKHSDKLAILRRRGIETVELADWSAGKADVVVEATGTAAGFTAAVAATRPRGTLVLKSTVAERPELDLAPIVIDEITVVGSRCGPFEPALQALAGGQIETDPLISDTLPLERGVEAFERASERGVLKVLLEIE
jgi:threonine dehydrogenase-like Zn-dependent dehydrogenase